jgi:polyphosphate kinase
VSALKAGTLGGLPSHPRYVNREASWLQFNGRVLAEAENADNPLLERLKFLAIFESNLDEFFMVRVSGLIEQEESGLSEQTPDGLNASQQLAMISSVARELRAKASKVWSGSLRPALAKEKITLAKWDELSPSAQSALAATFRDTVFPLCTPLMLDPAVKFPFISNRSLNMAVELMDDGQARLARIKLPPNLPRAVRVPGRADTFLLLEDLIAEHLPSFFPGVEIVGWHLFRVIRDADIEIRELEAADLITQIEQTLRLRRFGDPVLLELDATMAEPWVKTLRRGLQLDEQDVLRVEGLIGFDVLWEFYRLERPQLRFPVFTPYLAEPLATADRLFETVRSRDVMVHHPYDSFRSVEEFVASAANDDRVVGIKMTLYRVGSESPIVESLLRAAERGKQVAVMVELKARFDESNNLVWSRALERAGAHVTYGFAEMKTHAKLCLIVRNETNGIRQYAHVGTGNYNPATARAYTDIGLFTSDPDVCQDLNELFNYLTGFSKQSTYRQLLVAPLDLREQIIDRIEREAGHARAGRPAKVLFKLNSLVDPEVIDALYEASQAGVQIDLVVRGICCLRPGVKRMSETIRVVSVVGRFLEHSRVYYFENGGEPEAFIGSADMMRRNLDRRIEVLTPVRDPAHQAYLRDQVVMTAVEDNAKAWSLLPNGTYRRVKRSAGESVRSAQETLLRRPATAGL